MCIIILPLIWEEFALLLLTILDINDAFTQTLKSHQELTMMSSMSNYNKYSFHNHKYIFNKSFKFLPAVQKTHDYCSYRLFAKFRGKNESECNTSLKFDIFNGRTQFSKKVKKKVQKISLKNIKGKQSHIEMLQYAHDVYKSRRLLVSVRERIRDGNETPEAGSKLDMNVFFGDQEDKKVKKLTTNAFAYNIKTPYNATMLSENVNSLQTAQKNDINSLLLEEMGCFMKKPEYEFSLNKCINKIKITQKKRKVRKKLSSKKDGIYSEKKFEVNSIGYNLQKYTLMETVSQKLKNKKFTPLTKQTYKKSYSPLTHIVETPKPNSYSLRLENIGVIFRGNEILKGITWGIKSGDRIGLVGQNGSGKTIQLRIIMGEIEPTTGEVIKSNSDLSVAMLRQEYFDDLNPDYTLEEEFMSVFMEENNLLHNLRKKEMKLEYLAAKTNDTSSMQMVLNDINDMHYMAQNKNIYSIKSRVIKIINLMGFQDYEKDYLVAMFSGGWKMRIGLGKVLLKKPNILLLDEPTNHLDIDSVEWLEHILTKQNISLIMASHDREFLDRVCNKIIDIEGGICTEYDGNYSHFLELKKAHMNAWDRAYNIQEKKTLKERQWINKYRFKYPEIVKQRESRLHKLINSDRYLKKPPSNRKPFRFRFPSSRRLSSEVANIHGLYHSYENSKKCVFKDSELCIHKNDRIALVGPNGSGKSTLMRLLVGREQPDKGKVEIVGQNVELNYFEQSQADALDLSISVIDTVQKSSNGQSYNELRALLGTFSFKGDAVEKKVEMLSGGEKARLTLCCMMLKPVNFLILDEPTNHLDITTKEKLEEALQYFNGALITISHDRYFISRVATTIVVIENNKLVKYQGDYKTYLDKSKDTREKVEARAVKGIERLRSAPEINLDEKLTRKKNFGGAKTAHMVSRKNKGIRNANRMRNN